MSMYEKLDYEIFERIAAGNSRLGKIIKAEAVFIEASRLSWLMLQSASRLIERRLQALRKRGVIEFATGAGWKKVQS